jgi:hypothetical protein
MSGIRNEVKKAIQTIVQNAEGVKKVSMFRPKLMVQTDLPMVVVNLAKSKETRSSASAPFGKKRIQFTAQLEISTIDLSVDGSGQLDFDDLLDAIDVELRKDPTLGGVALGATVEYINTMTTPPQIVSGQNVVLMAVKQFDVSVQVSNA